MIITLDRTVPDKDEIKYNCGKPPLKKRKKRGNRTAIKTALPLRARI